MKNIVIVLMFIGLLTSIAVAQGVEQESEVYPEQASIEHNSAVKAFSQKYASLGRIISGNFSVADFINPANQLAIISQIGNDNYSQITQSDGGSNVALISIVGDDNEASVDQYGYDNFASLNIFGNSNRYSLDQIGNNNTFLGGIRDNGYESSYTQRGNGIRLELQGRNPMGLIIEQTGQGFGIIIENN